MTLNTEELMSLAERVVRRTQSRLPAHLRAAAEALPVVFHDHAGEAVAEEMGDPGLLGLFVGAPLGSREEGHGDVPAHIILYVAELYDFAEADLDVFADEVRLTYLHELGHYLGWDEDEVAARGLE